MILALPQAELRPSRFDDGPAFSVGRREVAHFHAGNELDIRLTRKVISAQRAVLAADKRATLRGSSDCFEFRFPRRADLARAQELVKLAFDANRSG